MTGRRGFLACVAALPALWVGRRALPAPVSKYSAAAATPVLFDGPALAESVHGLPEWLPDKRLWAGAGDFFGIDRTYAPPTDWERFGCAPLTAELIADAVERIRVAHERISTPRWLLPIPDRYHNA